MRHVLLSIERVGTASRITRLRAVFTLGVLVLSNLEKWEICWWMAVSRAEDSLY